MPAEGSKGTQPLGEIICLQTCDHEACTAAKTIANNPQAIAMTAGGKKVTENKMTYLPTICCEKVHFPSPALGDVTVLKVSPHNQHCQHHSDMYYHFKHCRDLYPGYSLDTIMQHFLLIHFTSVQSS